MFVVFVSMFVVTVWCTPFALVLMLISPSPVIFRVLYYVLGVVVAFIGWFIAGVVLSFFGVSAAAVPLTLGALVGFLGWGSVMVNGLIALKFGGAAQ